MGQMLQAREVIIKFYKRHEVFIVFGLKLVIGLVIFSMVAGIGRSLPMLSKIASPATSFPYIILMSIIFAVTPMNAGYLLITLNLCLQTSAVLEVSIVLAIFLFAVMGLYTRLAPTECVLILVMLAAYYFKLPYLVPILAGMYFSLTGIIPIAIATFMWQFLPVLLEMLKAGADTELSIGGLTAVYQSSYSQIVGAVTGNQDWIVMSFIYALVVVAVFAMSRSSIKNAQELAIALGGGITVFGFVLAVLMTDLKIGLLGVLLSGTASVALAYFVRFFDVILDYDRVERVQFQDEDNVYYVKIVPKAVLSSFRHEEAALVRPQDAPLEPRAERTETWAERWDRIERERQEQGW